MRSPKAIIIAIAFTCLSSSHATCNNTLADALNDAYHPHCVEAFNALPVNEHGQPIDNLGGLRRVIQEQNIIQHYYANSHLYVNYDSSCFAKWDDLSIMSRKFLSDNIGALFVASGSGQTAPYCMAFRVDTKTIVSASHCLRPNMQFRLVSSPADSFPVILPDVTNSGDPASDFTDYMTLNISGDPPPSSWSETDFSATMIAGQSIAIVAISIPVFYIEYHGNPSLWTRALRFSRVRGSQNWPKERIHPLPSNDQLSRCIFHRAPTFGGMSGAAVIGVTRGQGSSNAHALHVYGLHLRNGPQLEQQTGCGHHPDFNIALRIPSRVIRLLPSKTGEEQ